MAEPPSSSPNYIYPFMDSAESSNVNLFDFTYLMYRTINKSYSSTWVRVQRAGPDHAHAGGVRPDRVRTQQLRHTVSDCAAVESYLLSQAKDLFMPSSGQRPKGPGPLELTASYTGQAHRVAMCAGGLGQLVPPDMVGPRITSP